MRDGERGGWARHVELADEIERVWSKGLGGADD